MTHDPISRASASAKTKIKITWLERLPYPALPYLALVLSPEELDEAVRVLDKTARCEFPVTVGAKTFTFGLRKDVACIVALSEDEARQKPHAIYGLLVHEAVHVWQQHAKAIGEDTPGDEQEAYAIQVIAQRLIEEFDRRMKTKAKAKSKKDS